MQILLALRDLCGDMYSKGDVAINMDSKQLRATDLLYWISIDDHWFAAQGVEFQSYVHGLGFGGI